MTTGDTNLNPNVCLYVCVWRERERVFNIYLEFQLPLPTLVYSDFEDVCGVMVLEDWAPAKFKLDQPDLMRLVNPGKS